MTQIMMHYSCPHLEGGNVILYWFCREFPLVFILPLREVRGQRVAAGRASGLSCIKHVLHAGTTLKKKHSFRLNRFNVYTLSHRGELGVVSASVLCWLAVLGSISVSVTARRVAVVRTEKQLVNVLLAVKFFTQSSRLFVARRQTFQGQL